MTPLSRSQFQSRLRQAAEKQRRAISDYNAAVKRHNAEVKRSIDDYNRQVRTYNSRVRQNRERLRQELMRLNTSRSTTTYVSYRRSVVALTSSLDTVRRYYEDDSTLYGLMEGETANSVSVLNALLGNGTGETLLSSEGLQTSTISEELIAVSGDLAARWEGALYALNPRNPDAARHFCTSARELLSVYLATVAPDDKVIAADPSYTKTPQGGVSRRARIHYGLQRSGTYTPGLEDFAEQDVDNVMALFQDFNDATHGQAGRFDLNELSSIKNRVEEAVRFLYRITPP